MNGFDNDAFCPDRKEPIVPGVQQNPSIATAEAIDTTLTAECFNLVADGVPVPPEGVLERASDMLSRAATRVKDTCWHRRYAWKTIPVPHDAKRGEQIYLYVGQEMVGSVKCPFYAVPGWFLRIKVRKEHLEKWGKGEIQSSVVAKTLSDTIVATIPDGVHSDARFYILIGRHVISTRCLCGSPGMTLPVRLSKELYGVVDNKASVSSFAYIPTINRVHHPDDHLGQQVTAQIPADAKVGEPFDLTVGHRTVLIKSWPENAHPGSIIRVKLNQKFSVQVPPGVKPGERFPCRYKEEQENRFLIVKCQENKAPGDFQMFYKSDSSSNSTCL